MFNFAGVGRVIVALKESYFEKPSFNFKRNNNSSYSSEIKHAKRLVVDFESPNQSATTSTPETNRVSSTVPFFRYKSSFKAFEGQRVKSLQVIRQSSNFLMLFSEASVLKIFTFSGELFAHLSLAQPLPLLWNFAFDAAHHSKPRLVAALTIARQINVRIEAKKSHLSEKIRIEPVPAKKNALYLTEVGGARTTPDVSKVLTMRNQFQEQSLVEPKLLPLLHPKTDGSLIRDQAQTRADQAGHQARDGERLY